LANNDFMDIALIAILIGKFFGDINAARAPAETIKPAEAIVEPAYIVQKSYIGELTGYSSREEETDSTPFITAYGETVRWGTVATNAYPFGTKLRFPEIYGDKIFVVEDKMHSRYRNRIDIWFPEYEKALGFGIKNTKVEVLKENLNSLASL